MSNVVRTDIDSLNTVLTVTIPKEEYLDKVKKDIAKYTQRTAMRGFRPGKTPPKLVKKMYGTQFLMDAVNDKIQEKLNAFISTEKLDMLGQPIPSAQQEKFDMDINAPKDLEFKFDVGLVPEFEIAALKGAEYQRFAIQLDENMVSQEIENIRKKSGENLEVEGQVIEGDLLTLDVKEVGGTLEAEVTVSTSWMTDDMKSVFLTQSKGDSLQINLFQLEKETTPQYVRKYFLKLEDNDDRVVGENFHASISKITRVTPVELNEEFYQKNFGVATEEEAREQLTKALSSNYEAQADALLLRDVQERLIKENNFALPDEFLKRWLKTQNERNTEEAIEADYERFANNLRWSLIRSKILREANIEVTDEDMRNYYAHKVKGYFGSMPIDENFVNSLVDRVMTDEKQANELYEDVLTDKLFFEIKNTVSLVSKPITIEEFNSIMAAARYDVAKERGELTEAPQEATVEA